MGPRSFVPSHYLMMIIGVYATLGVFLIIAWNPAAHTSLIWFTVWSSHVHAVITHRGIAKEREHLVTQRVGGGGRT